MSTEGALHAPRECSPSTAAPTYREPCCFTQHSVLSIQHSILIAQYSIKEYKVLSDEC